IFPFLFCSYGHIFLSQGEDLIGTKYKKVVYREYTNGNFTWLQFRKEALITGIFCFHLGPLLHAEVGDSVLIVFKNKASRPYSISAHGVEEVGCEEQTEAPITLPGKAVLIVFLSATKAIYKKKIC
uniref:Plastocyanin-like domain-containing protein n=1 Tax=Meleagris gallopavo TaxID=9103 RepID=A0A803YRB9_MELGA